jgi:peptide/nickel transport system permease protein
VDRLTALGRVLRHNRRAALGFAGLVFFVLMALVGPLVVPLDQTVRFELRFHAPSWEHWLGTDHAGRDVLHQLVHGSRDVLLIAFSAAGLGTLTAVAVGLFAGLAGGHTERFIVLLIDVLLVLPRFPMLMILAALIPVRDPVSFGVVIALFNWPGLARSLRAEVLSLKEREFVEAARVMGLGSRHIVFNELAPNMASYISVNFIDMARGAITASIGIMFLGLVPLDVTNWGMMLNLATFNTGAIFIPSALAYVLAPLFAVVLFQYSMVAFASGLDEHFHPRLAGGA